MGKWLSWLILKIEMGHLGGWGTWVMGHMVNMYVWSCAGSCATSLILHVSLQNLLHIDIDVFYLYMLEFHHDGLILSNFLLISVHTCLDWF